ncbi:MAG: hypothetical protein WD934_01385 [Gemmatimonadales bacterium]
MIRPLFLLLLAAGPLGAQAPRALLEEARQAYLQLELERARALALRVLDGERAATAPDRANALMLLGTIAVLQRREPEALTRFSALIAQAPRYQPDTLITPSEPLQVFRRARENTKATDVEAWGGTTLRATVRVSSLHQVTVVVLGRAGDTVEVLWSGPIRDEAPVTWSPMQAEGRLTLVSASIVQGRVVREVRLPLEVTRRAQDTLPLPVAPRLQPVSELASSDWRLLAGGLGAGFVVLALPPLVGWETSAAARGVLALGLGAGGFVLYRRATSGEGAEVAAANARARAQWERERRTRIQENARRRAQVVVDVRVGAGVRVER